MDAITITAWNTLVQQLTGVFTTLTTRIWTPLFSAGCRIADRRRLPRSPTTIPRLDAIAHAHVRLTQLDPARLRRDAQLHRSLSGMARTVSAVPGRSVVTSDLPNLGGS